MIQDSSKKHSETATVKNRIIRWRKSQCRWKIKLSLRVWSTQKNTETSWLKNHGSTPKISSNFTHEHKIEIPQGWKKINLNSLSLVVPNTPISKDRRAGQPIWDLRMTKKFSLVVNASNRASRAIVQKKNSQQPREKTHRRRFGAPPNKANHLTTIRSKQIATPGLPQLCMPPVNQSTSSFHFRSTSTQFMFLEIETSALRKKTTSRVILINRLSKRSLPIPAPMMDKKRWKFISN